MSGSADGSLRIWDSKTGKQLDQRSVPCRSICALSYAPDGKSIAFATDADAAKVWETETTNQVFTLRGHRNRVKDCGFSHDGKLIFTASDDQTLKYWNATSGVELAANPVPEARKVAASRDGTHLALALNEKVIVFDMQTGEQIAELPDSTNCELLRFAADGKKLLYGGQRSVGTHCDIRVASIESNRSLLLAHHAARLTTFDFSRESTSIVSATAEATLKVTDISSLAATKLQTGEVAGLDELLTSLRTAATSEVVPCAREFIGHTNAITMCKYSPDGQWIFSVSWDKTLRVWDSLSGAEVAQFVTDSLLELVAFDDHTVITADRGGGVYFLDWVRA